MRIPFLVFIFCLFAPLLAESQTLWYKNGDVPNYNDYILNNADAHTAIKPWYNNQFAGAPVKFKRRDTLGMLGKKELRDADTLLVYEAGKTYILLLQERGKLNVRPVYSAQAGVNQRGTTLQEFMLGAQFQGQLNHKFGYNINVAAGSAVFPTHQDSIAKQARVLPGWGDRVYRSGDDKLNWQHISGSVTWQPSKVFYLSAGRDKHFWGEGHRSLFISDVSAPMTYLKQTTSIWKLQYTSLFTALKDYSVSPDFKGGFRNKWAAMHYISFNPTRWLNLSVFESVIWQGTDNNRFRGFDPNYLNPLVFYRPVEYSLGSSDNVFLGFAAKLRINRNNVLYGQILLDEFYLKEIRAKAGWWANKYGIQIGFKSYNVFFVENLHMQGEFNMIRPFTYSHGSVQQSYSHAGLPIAHPSGSNFAEVVGILAYDNKGFHVQGKLVVNVGGRDTSGLNYGNNVLLSYTTREFEYGNELFQGLTTTTIYMESRLSYTIPKFRWVRFELTAAARREANDHYAKNQVFVIGGLHLPLWNSSRDF